MRDQSEHVDQSRWFVRSLALTLLVGAALLVGVALRPGYAGFALASTLAFLIAGLLWTNDDVGGHSQRSAAPSARRVRATARLLTSRYGLVLARSYRLRTGPGPRLVAASNRTGESRPAVHHAA